MCVCMREREKVREREYTVLHCSCEKEDRFLSKKADFWKRHKARCNVRGHLPVGILERFLMSFFNLVTVGFF